MIALYCPPNLRSLADWLILASIQKLLNLNHDPRPAEDSHDPSSHGGLISHSTPILNEDGDPIWKVLVFDGMGRDVISSVLRVNDLRAWGITIHLYAIATPSPSVGRSG